MVTTALATTHHTRAAQGHMALAPLVQHPRQTARPVKPANTLEQQHTDPAVILITTVTPALFRANPAASAHTVWQAPPSAPVVLLEPILVAAPPPAHLAAQGNIALQAQVFATTAQAATTSFSHKGAPLFMNIIALRALLESSRKEIHISRPLAPQQILTHKKEHSVIFALQGVMQRAKAQLLAGPAHQENTIQRLAQAIQHLVFSVLKAPLALQAHHLATSAQQDAIQQQARHLVDSVMLLPDIYNGRCEVVTTINSLSLWIVLSECTMIGSPIRAK